MTTTNFQLRWLTTESGLRRKTWRRSMILSLLRRASVREPDSDWRLTIGSFRNTQETSALSVRRDWAQHFGSFCQPLTHAHGCRQPRANAFVLAFLISFLRAISVIISPTEIASIFGDC